MAIVSIMVNEISKMLGTPCEPALTKTVHEEQVRRAVRQGTASDGSSKRKRGRRAAEQWVVTVGIQRPLLFLFLTLLLAS